MTETNKSSPILNDATVAVYLKKMIVTRVARLKASRCPSAILGSVIAVKINSVKTGSWRRMAHIGIEIAKSFPARTYRNATASVAMPFDESWICTSGPHGLPSKELLGAGHSMRRVSLDQHLMSKTPATADSSSHQRVLTDDLFIPAITATIPKAVIVLREGERDGDETAETTSSQIQGPTHDNKNVMNRCEVSTGIGPRWFVRHPEDLDRFRDAVKAVVIAAAEQAA